MPQGAGLRDLGDAEVEDLDRELAIRPAHAEEVGGLEVPVDDAERVRVRDGLAGLEDEVDRLLDRQEATLLEPRREVESLEVVHHDVGTAVLQLPHVGHAGHVLSLDLGRRPGLLEKAADEDGLLEGLGQQELQRDPLVELEVMRGDDDAHPARPQDALDTVLARQHHAGPNAALATLHLGGCVELRHAPHLGRTVEVVRGRRMARRRGERHLDGHGRWVLHGNLAASRRGGPVDVRSFGHPGRRNGLRVLDGHASPPRIIGGACWVVKQGSRS